MEEDDKIAAEMAKAQTPEERKPIIEKFKEIKKQHLKEKKQKATKADKDFLGNLDNAIGYLTERRQLGENVYYDFNGHRLYSCDVTIASAYVDV